MVSVVIPTHNREVLLCRAIKSVCEQTYRDLEIIVVSDGEFDKTTDMVEKLIESDERIRYYRYPSSKGANYARNYGIEKSKGEFVAFLDDDDEWYPTKLEKQLKCIRDNMDVGLVYTGVHILYVNDGVEYSACPSNEGDLRTEILLENCIGTTSTVMVRKEILEQVGGFDEKLPALQDFDLWIRVCQLTEVRVIKEELINYYNYRNNVQISSFTRKYEESFQYIDEKYREKIECLSESEKMRREKNMYYLLVNKALRNNDSKRARVYIKKYLKSNWDMKMFAFYLLSYFNYKFILKLRSVL